jgi:hypothetical protein
MLGLDAGVLLGLEFLELPDHLSPGTAGDLVPPPRLAIRAVAKRHCAVPAALGFVLVDRSFVAPATAGAIAEYIALLEREEAERNAA